MSTKMKTAAIRKKLHHYIDTAHDKKIKAIFTIVEDEIEETYHHWEDPAFIEEMDRREKNYLNGTAKTYTLEQSVARARQAVKKIRAK